MAASSLGAGLYGALPECPFNASWSRQSRHSLAVGAAGSGSTNGRYGGSSQNGSVFRREEEYDFFKEVGGSRPSEGSRKRKSYDMKGNWGDKPYRMVPGMGKFYLDELDVITLLDPPRLSPLDPEGYSHAAFLWKKIGDIPEERRTRLLELMNPSLVDSMWRVTAQRYDSPKLFPSDAFSLLPAPEIDKPFRVSLWQGRIDGEVWPWSWLNDIKMEFFVGADAGIYGRLSCGGWFGSAISRYMPLYSKAKYAEFVSNTNHECDLALDFSDGELHLKDTLPKTFAKPGKLSWPLQEFVTYIRAAGPGVLVGELWDSYLDPRQAPPRKLGNMLIIKS